MKAYIIIGRATVGKSSLVRGLSGIRNADLRLMASLVGPDFNLWAKDSSLQEAKIDALKFIAEVNGKGVDAVLLTLWPHSRKSKGITYPDAATYIRDFIAAGWSIQPVALLANGGPAPSVTLPSGVLASHFTNNKTTAFNTFVASVRAHWGWV